MHAQAQRDLFGDPDQQSSSRNAAGSRAVSACVIVDILLFTLPPPSTAGRPSQRKFQIPLWNINPDRSSSQLTRCDECCTCSTEWIEHHAIFRTRRQDWNTTKIDGIRRKVQISMLGVFWENVPYIAWLASVGVIAQKIEAFFT